MWLRKEFPFPKYVWVRGKTAYGYSYGGRPGGISLRVKYTKQYYHGRKYSYYNFFDTMLATPTSEIRCYRKLRRQVINLANPRSLINLKHIVRNRANAILAEGL